MNTYKYQGLAQVTSIICIGLFLHATPLVGMEPEEQGSSKNFHLAKQAWKSFKSEAKKGSFDMFDQEAIKRHNVAIEADIQEKEREAAERVAYDEKVYNLEYKYRLETAR